MLNQREPDVREFEGARRPLRSVLVVEDDGLLSLMLQDLVHDAGAAKVFPCRDSGSAFEVLNCEPLDCAILDVSMHGGTTYDLADALAARDIPFLFCTGIDPRDLSERHRGRPVLLKPYSDADFRAVLAQALAA
jgi:CheY-like chemotaxis protein